MVACVDSSRNKTSMSPFSLDPIKNQCRVSKFCKPNLSSILFCNDCLTKARDGDEVDDDDDDVLWLKIKEEAQFDLEQEPILSRYYFSLILSQTSIESALANHLAAKLGNMNISSHALFEVFYGILAEDFEIRTAIRGDLKAIKEKDPACISYVHCFLNFKGFLACQSHRIAHKLWSQNRTTLALLIQSRVSEVFAVDIHPGAKIGKGIVFDHATGIVIGETCVIGNYVTILHNVTLGGTGKVSGDRHPKIGDGVFIGAGSSILGNVGIGNGAKIGAASVVLKEVPANATAVGNPARLVGGNRFARSRAHGSSWVELNSRFLRKLIQQDADAESAHCFKQHTRFYFKLLRPQANARVPPGPPKFQLMGNMNKLMSAAPHRALWNLSKMYGPLMLLKLGFVPCPWLSPQLKLLRRS
ncbi:Serine acetyltransferase, N-terminal [Dillenia turbinata]|uniref:serine O-acetyltransferase n=1 Tax=Dillenia turbinata TaxID=194707 RepID=A0AAN8UYQ3_9MAGN